MMTMTTDKARLQKPKKRKSTCDSVVDSRWENKFWKSQENSISYKYIDSFIQIYMYLTPKHNLL